MKIWPPQDGLPQAAQSKTGEHDRAGSKVPTQRACHSVYRQARLDDLAVPKELFEPR